MDPKRIGFGILYLPEINQLNHGRVEWSGVKSLKESLEDHSNGLNNK